MGGPPIYVVFIPMFVVIEMQKLQNQYIVCYWFRNYNSSTIINSAPSSNSAWSMGRDTTTFVFNLVLCTIGEKWYIVHWQIDKKWTNLGDHRRRHNVELVSYVDHILLAVILFCLSRAALFFEIFEMSSCLVLVFLNDPYDLTSLTSSNTWPFQVRARDC